MESSFPLGSVAIDVMEKAGFEEGEACILALFGLGIVYGSSQANMTAAIPSHSPYHDIPEHILCHRARGQRA